MRRLSVVVPMTAPPRRTSPCLQINGSNTPIKFVYCNRAETGDNFRPYDLVRTRHAHSHALLPSRRLFGHLLVLRHTFLLIADRRATEGNERRALHDLRWRRRSSAARQYVLSMRPTPRLFCPLHRSSPSLSPPLLCGDPGSRLF